jgi:hypothetical protein
MTRAERFEDEKKRIMESCFSKQDETGARKSRAAPMLKTAN